MAQRATGQMVKIGSADWAPLLTRVVAETKPAPIPIIFIGIRESQVMSPEVLWASELMIAFWGDPATSQ